MKRIIISLIVVIAIIAGISYALIHNKQKNEAQTADVNKTNPKVLVRADTIVKRMFDMTYIANGTFEPKQIVTLSSESSGRVARVLVEEGSHVKAGQTLAVVTADKINVGRDNSEATFNQAKRDLERFESAFKSGGVTQQQLDQAKLQYQTAKNNLRNAELNLVDANVRTSVSGIVNKRMIEPGTFVAPGTPSFEIVNVSTLKLRVNVDEKNVAGLNKGQQVEVKASVYPDKIYKGLISFVAPVADGSLNFPVDVQVLNTSDSELKAGMYGSAIFGSKGQGEVLVIPRTAFIGSVSDNRVYVVKEGKSIDTNVKSGRSFGNYIEILDGLKPGDIVVTSGQINLLSGTEIEIIK